MQQWTLLLLYVHAAFIALLNHPIMSAQNAANTTGAELLINLLFILTHPDPPSDVD